MSRKGTSDVLRATIVQIRMVDLWRKLLLLSPRNLDSDAQANYTRIVRLCLSPGRGSLPVRSAKDKTV